MTGERQDEPETGRGPLEAVARRAFFQTAAFALVLLLVSLTVQLPAGWGPASLRQYGGGFSLLWHQGWDFFTSEMQQVAVAYQPAADGADPTLISTPLASGHDAWGADRAGGLAMIEIEQVADQVPDADWRPCRNPSLKQCPADPAAPRYVVHDNVPDPAMCGLDELVVEAPEVSASTGSVVWQPLRESTVEVLCAP